MASSIDSNYFMPVVSHHFSYKAVILNYSQSFELFAGARQEQDIFVRLIDSVTKQVKYFPITNKLNLQFLYPK